MECFNCKSCYNDTLNPPHFLIECGHSLCNRCLKANFNNQTIICPECKAPNRAQSLSAFPKNLALLYFKPPAKAEKTFRASVHSDSLSMYNSKDSTALCSKHCKTLEAFCENDRQLLCIACVLQEGYKDRDTCTIQDAAEKERILLEQAFKVGKLTESKLRKIEATIEEAKQMLNNVAEKAEQEVGQFFEEIRRLITERETTLKNEITKRFKKEERLLEIQGNNVSTFFKDISVFNENYEQSLKEDDISLLSSSIPRLELMKRITAEPDNIEVDISFDKLDKSQELHLIYDMLSQLDSDQVYFTQQDSNPEFMSPITDISNILSHRSSSKDIITKYHPSVQSSRRSKENIYQSTTNLNGAWANRKGEKASTLKKILTHSTKSIEKKETPINKNLKSREMVSERIPVLDHQGNSSPYIQKPDKTIDTKMMSEEKQNIRKSLCHPSKGTHTPKPISTTVATIDLSDISMSTSRVLSKKDFHEKKSLMIETPRHEEPWLSDRIELRPKSSKSSKSGVFSTTNKARQSNIMRKCDIQVMQSPSSSFHTNRDLLDLLNSERKGNNLMFRLETESNKENKPRNQLSRQSNIGVPHTTKNYPQKILTHKSSLGSLQKESVCLTSRDEWKQSQSVMSPETIQSPLDGTSIKLIGSKCIEYPDSANKFDLSAFCQNLSSYVYILGGYADNPQLAVDRLDLQKGQWEVVSVLPHNLRRFASVVLPESKNIILLGGKEEGIETAKCLEFNVSDDKFKYSEITLTRPKSGFGALVIGDDIFVCGGSSGKDILRSFESYSLRTKKWKALPPMKHKRHEFSLVLGLDQRIYAIGGLNEHNSLPFTSVERYDPYKRTWEEIAPMNVGRTSLSAVTLPDGIYAIGGNDGYNYLKTVEKYDDATNRWIYVSSMNYTRSRFDAVVSNDSRNIYVFGGYNNSGAINSVERYSVISDSWDVVEPMRSKRSMHCAVMVTK